MLGERAARRKFRIPGRSSSGGGCRLYDATGGAVALNLARPEDRELLPALFEAAALDVHDDEAISAQIARCEARLLVARGRMMGLAIAAEDEAVSPSSAVTSLTKGREPRGRLSRQPKVLDLSALWAGPLAAHLLWLIGATVTKVEGPTRRDAMRDGDGALFALLDQGKKHLALDLRQPNGRRALIEAVTAADVVIEAARPRALIQLGIDVDELVCATPGLVWVTITGHGVIGEAVNWIGFGDDCGVAAGLSAALRRVSGRGGFVGDAIADPLSGIRAAQVAWEAWSAGSGGRFAVSMSGVAAQALEQARAADPVGLGDALRAWSAASGKPFPTVHLRSVSC